MKELLQTINKKKKITRLFMLTISLIISALIYNLFLLPLNIVSGGTGGIATITKHLYRIDPSLMILILSIACLIISLMYLGKEKTLASTFASFAYPILINITKPICQKIPFETSDMFIIVIFAGVLSGLSNGMMYKTGYNSGGLTIISQILYEKFKIPVSKSSLLMNLVIVFIGGLFFGSTNAMYAMIYLYINSLVTEKVLLGISNNKAFYIITSEQERIKEYIFETLGHSVTIFDVKGGFLSQKEKVILTVVPTRNYYKLTEGIKKIDKSAFFVVTDSYEVIGGK